MIFYITIHIIAIPLYTVASHKPHNTEQVLLMLDLSDDEYFEEVDSDHQVNEREQDCEADREACNT